MTVAPTIRSSSAPAIRFAAYSTYRQNPDVAVTGIAPPSIIAHENLTTEISYYTLFRLTAINYGEQTVAIFCGMTAAF